MATAIKVRTAPTGSSRLPRLDHWCCFHLTPIMKHAEAAIPPMTIGKIKERLTVMAMPMKSTPQATSKFQ